MVPSNGSPGNQITFGAYGSGIKPIISGADLVITWKEESPNIWVAAVASEPKIVFFDGIMGTLETSKSNLNTEREWFWADNILLIYSTSSPDTTYTNPGIEISIRNRCVVISNKSYITIGDLEVKFAYERTLFIWGDSGYPSVNISVERCDIHHSGHRNLEFIGAGVSSSEARECNIHHAGLGGVAGSGIGIQLGAIDVTIERCEIYSNKTNGIELKNGDNCIIRYNNIHDNLAHGIDNINDSRNNKFYYNLIYQNGMKGFTMSDNSGIKFYNNVVYNQQESENDGFVNLFDNDAVVKNNIFFENNTPIQVKFGGNTVTSDYNCYFTSGTLLIQWNGTPRSMGAHKSTSRQDANSISSNPLFMNAAEHDFSLQTFSPCIDTGINVGLANDYSGTSMPWGKAIDIGAIEYLDLSAPTNLSVISLPTK